jgi:hypothetical protein
LRLRTACDLQLVNGITATRPTNFTIPEETELLEESKRLINACNSQFAEPAVTIVSWKEKKKATKKTTE